MKRTAFFARLAGAAATVPFLGTLATRLAPVETETVANGNTYGLVFDEAGPAYRVAADPEVQAALEATWVRVGPHAFGTDPTVVGSRFPALFRGDLIDVERAQWLVGRTITVMRDGVGTVFIGPARSIDHVLELVHNAAVNVL